MHFKLYSFWFIIFLLVPISSVLAQGITITDNQSSKVIIANPNTWVKLAQFTLGENYSTGHAILQVNDLAADLGNKASYTINITVNRLTGGASAQWNYTSNSHHPSQSELAVYQDGNFIHVYQRNGEWGSRVNSASITGTALRTSTTVTLYPQGSAAAAGTGSIVLPNLPITLSSGDVTIANNLTVSKRLHVGDRLSVVAKRVGYDVNNMTVGGPVLDIAQDENRVNESVALLKMTSFNASGAIGVTYNQTNNADMIFGVNNGYWDPNNPALANIIERMRIKANGNILIGKTSQTNSAYKLDVEGDVRANKIVVNTNGADFVFEKDYALKPLSEVEQFIKAHQHLPEIPSAADMQANGVSVGDLNIKLLQKIEELTLHIIQQQKELNSLKAKVKQN